MALISEEGWKKHISSLKARGNTSREELKQAVVKAVKDRIPKKRFGVMFSGGVDSSLIALIAKQQKADFICYAVGVEENAADLIYARKAAKGIGIKLKTRIFSLRQSERVIRETTRIVGDDFMKTGVGAVVYSAMEMAKKDKVNVLFSGLGAEEIFAGYERHLNAKDVNKECWKGLKAMWRRDLTRDTAIAEKLGIKIATPFLDDDLIRAAMQIDGKQKINKNCKKVVLRKIAEESGMPRDIAWRKKQAAQYGSKFDRAIYRLGKKKGFKYKKAYLRSLIP